MSGGHFDYNQYRIDEMAEELQRLIDENDSTELNEYGEELGRHYPPEIIQRFKAGVYMLKTAAIYAQRIDWLVSGDDGEPEFMKRLNEELTALDAPKEQNRER